MPDKPNGKMNFRDRCFIEDGVKVGLSAREMAEHLGVAKSTVCNELKRNRGPETPMLTQRGRNVCSKKDSCMVLDLCKKGCMTPCYKCKKGLCNQICSEFEASNCPKLERFPYVCNACHERLGWGCGHPYSFYNARIADEKAAKRRSDSRKGIDCAPEDLDRVVKLVKPLMKKGQSLDHIWATHSDEIPFSKRTFYRYITKGVVSDIIPLDLPFKVRRKPNRKKGQPQPPRHEMKGRTYLDFLDLSLEEQMSAVEMDCVVSARGSDKAILTLLFRRFHFQLMLLLDEKTQEQVAHALDLIEGLIGLDCFKTLFRVVLTDRGSEFLDFELLERGLGGGKRCKIYYCDPMKSGQKGACEKNHVELRKILPKGTSFKNLTRRDLAVACSHVNSYKRPALGGASPFQLAAQVLPEALIEGLGLELIPADEVMLKPSLISLHD